MKVTQEKLPGSQIGLEIEVPAETSRKAYEQVISKFMRSAQIPGFRKGKVPRQVLLQRLGQERIRATTVEELVEDSLKAAVDQAEIEAIGNFQLRSPFEDLVTQFKPGEALVFSASVDVPPEVRLDRYTDLSTSAAEKKYDPAQVETVLKEQQTERAALIPVEGRVAQAGDVALVDFSGRLSGETDDEAGEEIPGGQAQDFQIELVEGQFVEGFVDGIIGMTIDETKEVPVVFPQTYPQAELAGRAATFAVTLKEIKEKELPLLDDDFAQEVSEFETLAELRSFLEKRFQAEAKQQTEANIEKALLDQLLDHLEVELPETLILKEVKYLLNQTAIRLQEQGIDIKQLLNQDMLPEMRERLRPEATTRIKRTLILAEVAKRESIKAELPAIEERVQSLRSQFGDKEIDPERLQQVVEEELLQEKVIQWLREHSQVELIPEAISTSTIEAVDETVGDRPSATEAVHESIPETGSSSDQVETEFPSALEEPSAE